jgi:hypothetical protein
MAYSNLTLLLALHVQQLENRQVPRRTAGAADKHLLPGQHYSTAYIAGSVLPAGANDLFFIWS